MMPCPEWYSVNSFSNEETGNAPPKSVLKFPQHQFENAGRVPVTHRRWPSRPILLPCKSAVAIVPPLGFSLR
jgi:hypothetical protein